MWCDLVDRVAVAVELGTKEALHFGVLYSESFDFESHLGVFLFL